MAVSVTIVGNRDLAGRFTRIVEAQRRGLRKANRETAAEVMRRWRGYTRSSRIARGLKAVGEGDARVVVSVGSEIGFNPVFEEEDTRAHVIKAKNASVLTDGTQFFGPVVNHPGTTGSHAGRRAVRESEPGHRQRITRVLRSEGA